MDTLEITTGQKRISIVRDGEQVGEITFNPTDASFAERFYFVLTEFKNEMNKYQSRHAALVVSSPKDADELESAPEQIELLKETCTYVRGRIDYLFGAGTSQTVFGDALVLEAFEQFFERISPFITDVRAQKVKPYFPDPRKNGHSKAKKPRARK